MIIPEESNAWLEKADNETLAKTLSRLAVLAQEKVHLIWSSKNEN